MYKVTLMNRTITDGNELVILIPNLTKYFESSEDANKYFAYLMEFKTIQGFMPNVEKILFTENLDVTQLKRQDAISKLSSEELALLGITY
jgi:hypothetical protein